MPESQPFISPRTLFAAVMGIIFLAESLIMLLFYFFGEDTRFSDVLIVGALLILFVSGPLYLILYRAFRRQGREAENAAETLYAIERHMPDALVAIDARGMIERFNPAAEQMFGWREDQAVGRNVGMLMPGPYARLHDEYILRYLQTGSTKVMGSFRELQAMTSAGRLFPIEIKASEMLVGRRRGFVAVIRDISERLKAEAEKQAMQLKADELKRLESLGVLAGGLSHDFKNILSVIQGNAELVAGERGLSFEAHQQLDGITEGCHRAVVCAGRC